MTGIIGPMPAEGANSNKGGVQGLLDLLKEAGTMRPEPPYASAACVKIAGPLGRPFHGGGAPRSASCTMPPPGTDREDCRRFGAVKRFCHNVKCANYGIVQLVRPNGVPVACAYGTRRPLHAPLAHSVCAVSCDPARFSCLRCRSRLGSPAHLQVPGEGLLKAAATTGSILPVAAAGRQ